MSLNCHYHPGREATEKCDHCGKLLCLECKRVYQYTYSEEDSFGDSTFSDTTYHYMRYELCPECKFNVELSRYNSKLALVISSIITIFVSIILIALLAMHYLVFNFPPDYVGPGTFAFIPILIIALVWIITVYRIRVSYPRAREKIYRKKDKFLKSVGSE